MKKSAVILSLLLMLALLCWGCVPAAELSAIETTAPTSDAQDPLASDPNLQRPASYGIAPASQNGLSVYGGGELKAGSDQVQVEIDTKDLPLVAVGSTVTLMNLSDTTNPILYQGVVSKLPDGTPSEDICYIFVTLEIADTQASAPETTTQAPATQSGGSTATSEQTTSSSSGFAGASSLPVQDITAEATISLPGKQGVFTIPIDCVLTGADGLTYVWMTEADAPQSVQTDDIRLVRVETGDSDGKKIEILSGLTEKSYVVLPI